MAERFRHEAREWLKDNLDNWICVHINDQESEVALVENLYGAGAVKVEVGGLEEYSNEGDTLFVTLPEDKGKALEVMVLLAGQHGDEVEFIGDGKDVVRIYWD